MNDRAHERARMIERDIAGRGVTDHAVLTALACVPREAFLSPELQAAAYDDSPLPIGEGQTISQPYIVAVTIDALRLRGGENVLEIGTGSGYAAAVLAQIAGHVTTVERHASLARSAARVLRRLGCDNVTVVQGDGSLGHAARAPYDAIAVAAAAPEVPAALVQQLTVGGRLVLPVGPDPSSQRLVRVTRLGERETKIEPLLDVRFVPLIGDQGFADASGRSEPRHDGQA